MKPMKTRQLLPFAAIILTAAQPALAATIPWDGNGTNNASGNWSTANLWDTDKSPGGTDTAVLTDVTSGTRTVTFDTTATSPVQQVNFDQTTAGATNILDVQKNLSVTNLITLGAPAGTERINIGSTAAAGFVLSPVSGLTLDTGGNLVMTATGNNATSYNLGNTGGTGTFKIQGGTLTVAATTGTSSSTSASNTLSGSLTMTSGSLFIDNAGGGTVKADRRLLVQGTLNITGGSVTAGAAGSTGFFLTSTTNATFNPTSFDYAKIGMTLSAAGAQSLSTNQTLGQAAFRETGVKTVTSSAVGTGIGSISMFDNNATASSRTTLKLGSNLTSTSGAGLPAAQSFGNTHEAGRVDLGIDTNGNTFDLTAGAASGVWTPNVSTQSGVTNTVWDLSGGGVIKANGINLSTANVTTNIGANTTLLVTGGNNTTFHLGSNGTIDPSANLRYSGSAVIGTPALITSFRDLGDIEVTSGALRLRSFSTGTQQDLRVSGGTMDLDGSTARSFTTISLTGGTLTNGTFATAETDYTGLETGTVAGKLTGAGKKFIKNSAGTLTLSGTNDFTGAAQIQSGTLAITTAGAFGSANVIDVMGGTLDLGGTTNLQKFTITLTNGGVIQNGALLRAGATTYTWSKGTVSANLTSSGVGAINLIKNTADTVLLSGANNYAGNTTVSAGILTLSNAPDPLNANPGNDASIVTIASTGATLNLTYTGTDKVDKLFIGTTQMAAGTYGPSATSISQITGSGTLTVASGPAGGFTTWITGTFVNGTVPVGQQGANADPDDDGISNLVEYAISGQDPTVSNGTIGTLSGNTLSFSKRLPLASDITYAIEESTDLGIADAWANVVPTVNDGTTISYTLPGGPAKDFQRLKITQP